MQTKSEKIEEKVLSKVVINRYPDNRFSIEIHDLLGNGKVSNEYTNLPDDRCVYEYIRKALTLDKLYNKDELDQSHLEGKREALEEAIKEMDSGTYSSMMGEFIGVNDKRCWNIIKGYLVDKLSKLMTEKK